MSSKQILARATFGICFAVSSLFVGLFFDAGTIDPELYKIVRVRPQAENASVGKKIFALLQQDKENGDDRNADEYSLYDADALPSLGAKSEIISAYARKSGRMNDSGLPPDFQFAWRKHMKAWASYSEFLEKADRAGMDLVDIKRFEDEYTRDINSTWFEVLRLGALYGANFSD